ncbi:family 20 glycosylhydrolase [Nonomuraea sp. NPDC050547]|uniref:family 20 glycosylhydrolase n=1 Tax=Nonomuraea sp. NPDC050547 TaxID=3364368 RepID=UPI0037AAB8D2
MKAARVTVGDPSLQPVADVVADLARPHPPLTTDLHLTLGDLTLAPVAAGAPISGGDECHRITTTPTATVCRARTHQGLFRAALHTSLYGPPHAETVEDGPRYAWRGLMLDTARHFWTVPELRQIIDLAAIHRLNVLHLHLTDNEGWRIQIPGLPRLTAGTPHYSTADYTELQRYAARRHVVIVPEIDFPGHSAAALRAYPDLAVLPAPTGWSAQLPAPVALDPREATTRDFVSHVLTELCRMTEGPYVHFGGDEAFGMDGTLYDQAVVLARAVIRAGGKQPLGWQESARAGLDPGDVAQWWVDPEMIDLPTPGDLDRRPELAALGLTGDLIATITEFFAPSGDDLARIVGAGGRVLLSPQSHLYLDRPYAPAIVPEAQRERAAGLGFIYEPRTVRDTAGWDPGAYGLGDEHVAGVEAALWSETLRGFDDLTTMLLPRLATIARTAWTGRPTPWNEERRHLAADGRLWAQRGLTFLRSTEIDWT